MKFKKTLALMMTATLGFTTLTGCSETTIGYTKELAKTAEWESVDSTCNGSLTIEMQGVKQELSFTSTGYTSKDKGYLEMKITDPNNILNIPEIKAYIDGGTAYINKGYYEGIYTMSGQAIPDALKNINAEYIGIDSGVDYTKMQAMMSEPDAILNFSKLIFGESDIDLPYTQNGREYTLNLDSNETVDLGVKGIKAISNNLENINNTLGLQLTTQDMDEIKSLINDKYFDEAINTIRENIAGSTISSKEVFTDDKYTMDLDMNILIKDLCNIGVKANGVTSKVAEKEITIPSSVAKLTQEEYINIMTVQEQNINTSTLVKAIDEVA